MGCGCRLGLSTTRAIQSYPMRSGLLLVFSCINKSLLEGKNDKSNGTGFEVEIWIWVFKRFHSEQDDWSHHHRRTNCSHNAHTALLMWVIINRYSQSGVKGCVSTVYSCFLSSSPSMRLRLTSEAVKHTHRVNVTLQSTQLPPFDWSN